MANATGKIIKTKSFPYYEWSFPLSRREDDEFEGEKWPDTEESYRKVEENRRCIENGNFLRELKRGRLGKIRKKVRSKWMDKTRGITDDRFCV